jgi:hypothetical protein
MAKGSRYVDSKPGDGSRETKMGVTRGKEILAGEPRGMTRMDEEGTRNTMRAGVQRSKAQARKQKRGS